MKNIAILAGGYSSERQISLNTADQIFSEIDKSKYNCFIINVDTDGFFLIFDRKKILLSLNDFSALVNKTKVKFDFVINALHGTPGEDGKVQGLLDMLKIPYSSSGVLTSSLTFDKIATKKILANLDFKMAKMLVIQKKSEIDVDAIVKEIGLPCFVKPNTSGSSYGITKVYKKLGIIKAIELAYTEDDTVIIEEFIDGIEVSCGVVKTQKNTRVLPITEIDTKNDYFDTEAKYDEKVTDEITPARVPEEHSKKVQHQSLKIYEELNCKGIVRVDFIIKNGEPYFLELNTIPGMSAASIVPKQLRTVGLSIGKIFEEIIQDYI